jgi:DNA-binding protein HU-beta
MEMNKADLVNAIAKETGLSKVKSGEALDAFVTAVSESLKNGDKVTLVGFGTFTTSQREARKGRNPKTGEVINIPSKRVAKFKAGSELTKSVN